VLFSFSAASLNNGISCRPRGLVVLPPPVQVVVVNEFVRLLPPAALACRGGPGSPALKIPPALGPEGTSVSQPSGDLRRLVPRSARFSTAEAANARPA